MPANRKIVVDPSEIQIGFNRPSGDARSYREFYYETKLGWSPSKAERDETLKNRRSHVREYLEGLHWILHYYHNGCPSWDWYFPQLYSPLCTDIVNIREFYEHPDESEIDDEGFAAFKFEQTEPFPSLGQLLSVLPPQSATLLPPGLGELMTNSASPIAEYYPAEFETDANGKRQPWEAVVQIPFIEGGKLLEVVTSVINSEGEDMLSVAERKRNERGMSTCFVPERENGATEANFPPIVEQPRRRPQGGGRGRGRGRGRGGRGRGGGGGGRGPRRQSY
jgi:5'-3' exoribonuclease 1